MKVLIAGYGNMGKTYSNSFIGSRFIKPEDIFLLVKNTSNLILENGVSLNNCFEIPTQKLGTFDIVILAVKPQDFNKLAISIKPFLNKNQLILSVMAGVTIATIQECLGCNKIIRSMPNIPTQIGMGMTVFSAANAVDRKELFIIQNLINTTGKSIYIENESLLNAATAVSGSGPAYVFFFMNAMIKAAVQLGFSESEAELLVNQTFKGSVAIQSSFSLSNQDWINKVASKGGTTEQALTILNNTNTEINISEAIFAANKKAIELGT